MRSRGADELVVLVWSMRNTTGRDEASVSPCSMASLNDAVEDHTARMTGEPNGWGWNGCVTLTCGKNSGHDCNIGIHHFKTGREDNVLSHKYGDNLNDPEDDWELLACSELCGTPDTNEGR